MSDFAKDLEVCNQYARYKAHVPGWQLKTIYWTMFVVNLFVLFLASWTYIRAQDTIDYLKTDPKKCRKHLRLYILLGMIYVVISACIVVMEAYALLALQFCDGEELISLYWSTFTMIQAGSLTAMIGIILALIHSLKDRKHPPWALALGTPVLVIAGLLYCIYTYIEMGVKKFRRPTAHAVSENNADPSISQRITPGASDNESIHINQENIIGHTTEGGPIVRFASFFNARRASDIELLGYCDSGEPIVAYRQESVSYSLKRPEA